MAKRQPVFLTGVAEVDRRLAKMEARAIKKLLPKAAKRAGETVKQDFKARVPVDTGALKRSITSRVFKNKIKKADPTKTVIARGGYMKGKRIAVKRVVAEDVGAKVIIDRNRLTKEAGKRRSALPIDRERGGMFFYAAVVELGNRFKTGNRTLTKALYDNEKKLRIAFRQAMIQLVIGGGK